MDGNWEDLLILSVTTGKLVTSCKINSGYESERSLSIKLYYAVLLRTLLRIPPGIYGVTTL